MHRAIWLIPPAVFAGVVSLAFVPLQRPDPPPVAIAPPPPPRPPLRPVAAALPVSIPDRELEPAPRPVAAPAPVVAAAAPQAAPRPAAVAVAGLPAAERSSYASQIQYHRRMADTNKDAAAEMRAIGALSRAMELLQEGSGHLNAASCLNNQLQRGVPFYNGKATCSVAVN
jgi:hypothetical protein